MDETRIRILIAENDPAHVDAIRRGLANAGMKIEIRVAATLREYRDAVVKNPPDLAIVDLKLPDGRATEALTFPADAGAFPVLIMTDDDGEQSVVDVLKSGAMDYMVRSADTFRDMPRIVSRALREWDRLWSRRQTERALREANEYLETLFNYANAPIIVWDPQFKITRFNHAFEWLTGRKAEAVIGQSLEILFHPAQASRSMDLIRKTLGGGRGETVEIEIHKADGEVRTVLWNSATVFAPDGNTPVAAIAQGKDITERKRAEEALRDANWRLENIIEGTHVGTWEWNVQTGETVFNEVWAQILGYTLEELAPISIKTWETLAHPDDMNQSAKLLEQHFAGELPYYDCECRMKHKDGHWVWVHDRGRIITRTADGKPLMMFGTHTDITERKQAEERLKRSEAQLVEAQAVAKVGSWETDLLNLKVIWSEETYRIFEIDPNSFHPSHPGFLSFVHPEDRAKVDAAFVGSLDKHSVNAIEHRVVTPGGLIKFMEERWQIFYDDQGRPTRAAGTCQDITERKRAENENRQYQERLRAATSELAMADEKHRRAIATEIHDGLGQLMSVAKLQLQKMRTALPPQQQPGCDSVLETLDEAIRSGRSLIFELSPPILYELGFEPAVEWLTEQYQQRHPDIRFSCSSDKIGKRLTENMRIILFQAVRELLFNVVKHAKARQAQVRIQKVGTNIRVTVTDDGIGPSHASEANEKGRSSGFGLFAIRERLRPFGGSIETRPASSGGTEVVLVAPLDAGTEKS